MDHGAAAVEAVAAHPEEAAADRRVAEQAVLQVEEANLLVAVVAEVFHVLLVAAAQSPLAPPVVVAAVRGLRAAVAIAPRQEAVAARDLLSAAVAIDRPLAVGADHAPPSCLQVAARVGMAAACPPNCLPAEANPPLEVAIGLQEAVAASRNCLLATDPALAPEIVPLSCPVAAMAASPTNLRNFLPNPVLVRVREIALRNCPRAVTALVSPTGLHSSPPSRGPARALGIAPRNCPLVVMGVMLPTVLRSFQPIVPAKAIWGTSSVLQAALWPEVFSVVQWQIAHPNFLRTVRVSATVAFPIALHNCLRNALA